jgi:WD40 repeat protein
MPFYSVMDPISLGASYFSSCLAGFTTNLLSARARNAIERRQSLQQAENHNISRGIYQALVEATLYRSEAQLMRFDLGMGWDDLLTTRREHDRKLRLAHQRRFDIEGHQAVCSWARAELNELQKRDASFFETNQFEIDPTIGFEDQQSSSGRIAALADETQAYVAERLAIVPPASIFEVWTEESEAEGRDGDNESDISGGAAGEKQSGAGVLWDEYFRDSLRDLYNTDRDFQGAVTGNVLTSLQSGQERLAASQDEIIELFKKKTQVWGRGIPAEMKKHIADIRSQIGNLVVAVREEGAESRRTTREEAQKTRADIRDVDAKVQRIEHLLKEHTSWRFKDDSEAVFPIRWYPKYVGNVHSQFTIFGRPLDQWEEDLREQIQLLVIRGEGGLGKSTIVEGLWSRLRPDESTTASPFDVAIAVSMEHGQPLSAAEIAEKVIPTLTQKKGVASVTDLAHLVWEKRVVFIIDSLEEAMTPNCEFKKEYADLQDLLLALTSAESKATTIIGTRSLPQIIARIIEQRPQDQIRDVQLDGLSSDDALAAIEQNLGKDAEGLITETNRSEWKQVISRLGGNPFVCFAVARMIKNYFDENPGEWLEAAEGLPSEAQEIYEWHWEQLGEREDGLKEREILLWLALSQGPVSTEELKNDLWSAESRRQFENSLHRLQRQLPLEESNGVVSAHSYITEFSAHRVIDISTNELTARLTDEHARGRVVSNASDHLRLSIDAFKNDIGKSFQESNGPTGRVLIDHCLVKASASAPARDFQRRSVVQPILRELQDKGLEGSDLRDHLRNLLKLCSNERWGGYLAGNLLTLLRSAGNGWIEEVDAPGLRVCQLDLRGAEVQSTNLSDARLQDVYFTQRLGEVRTLSLSPPAGRKQQFLVAGDDAGAVTIWRIGQESPILRHDRHDGSTVRAVAFSPNGDTVASADKNGQVWVWRPWESDEQLRSLRTENGSPKEIHDSSQLRSLAFTEEGYLLTSAESPTVWLHALKREKKGRGGSHLVFDLNDTCEAEADDKSKRVHVIRFHGRRLYAGTKNGRVYEVDLSDLPSENSAVERPTFREISAQREVSGKASGAVPCHQGSVFAIAVSPDGKRLATGGTDRNVHVWRLPALDHVDTFNHGDEVFSLAFLGGSERLASGGEDASIAIWDLRGPRLEKRVRGSRLSEGHDQRVRALAAASVSESTTVLCSGGFDRRLIQWDEQMNPVSIVEGYANGLKGLGTTGTLIAAAYGSGAVATWDRAGSDKDTGSNEVSDDGSLPERRREVVHEHEGPAYCVACAPSGEWVASGGRDGKVMIKFFHGSTSPANRRPEILDAHNHWVWSVDVSPDGRQIASCGEDGRVHLWNLPLEDRRPILCTDGASNRERGVSHSDRARVVRYHPDSERRLLASGGYDYAVRFWDTSSGEQRGVLPGAEDWVRALDFSEKWCAAAWGESVVRVWKVDDLLSCDRSWAKVQFHKWQAGSDGMEKLLVVPTPSSILALKFRSDSQIVAGGEDTQVRVWETADNSSWKSPKNVYTFSRHEHEVTSLSILEGGFVCSGDEGGKGWIWHPEKPEEEAVPFSPVLPYQGLDLTGATRTSRDSETPQALSRAEVQTLRQLGAEA